jgi:hypothetical protein
VNRDRNWGSEETRAFLAARERATQCGIPDEVAVYRLADRIIRDRDNSVVK